MNYYNLRKAGLALALCCFLIPVSRALSPRAIIDGSELYLAYLPLSVAIAMMLIFGRTAILPLFIAFSLCFALQLPLSLFQILALDACILIPVMAGCLLCRRLLSRRWRYALPGRGVGVRLFVLGFVTPCAIKLLMLLCGPYLHYPHGVSAFFGESSLFYCVVDIQSLIIGALTFSVLFYYPGRMALNKTVARAFWQRCVVPPLAPEKRWFTFAWLALMAMLVFVFCIPFKAVLISGYMVPVIFILFAVGIFQFGPRLINLLWTVVAFLLLTWNEGYMPEEHSQFALCFMLSVFIAFTVSLLLMTVIFQRNARTQRRFRLLAQTDPLTHLPNLRALEEHLLNHRHSILCCVRLANLEFLSRHYGLLMRIHCKRTVTRMLQPWLYGPEKVFHLPGSELLLVLSGPEPASRLRHMIDLLNSKRINWHNAPLEISYSAAWSPVRDDKEALYRLIGQLSFLAEQAQTGEPVLSLNEREANVSGQTTGQVLMLQKVKRVLEEGSLMLYAQPIVNARGGGYREVLSRLQCDGELITPDKFLPTIAQFNLSARFDLLVLEKLLAYLHAHPVLSDAPRFSVNLLPMTLMQKGIAQQIVSRFTHYGVPFRSVIIEVTEEQAFSDADTSLENIALLRASGLRIAIDDFGTGYANYERLKHLQADIIKIDGCFIKDIENDVADRMIVKSICELAKVKSLTVVAEYVETQAQRELLYALGVEYVQGYLTGRPEPLAE